MMEFTYNPPDVPLSILYLDRSILVADKPAGLLSVPGKLAGREDCLETRIRRTFPGTLLVHRLDCDTSGVMIFARNKAAQGFLGQEFEQRRTNKTYVARVLGQLEPDQGRVDLPIGVDWPNRPRQIVDPVNGRPACARGIENIISAVAKRRNDANSGDGNAPHGRGGSGGSCASPAPFCARISASI